MISSVRDPDFVNITGHRSRARGERVTNLKAALQTGSLEALNTPEGDSAGGILLGKDLAAQAGRRDRRLGVGRDAGADAVADGPVAAHAAAARRRHVQPRPLRARFDATGFVVARRRQAAVRQRQIDLIQLRVDDIFAAPEIAQSITARLGRPVSRRRTGPT